MDPAGAAVEQNEQMRIAVQSALDSSDTLPCTPLPADTRIAIPGCPRANYVCFSRNFKPSALGAAGIAGQHTLRFDAIGAMTVPARKSKRGKQAADAGTDPWQELVIRDATRAVSIAIMAASASHEIALFAGMTVANFLDRVSIASSIPRHLLRLAFEARPDELVDTADLEALLSAVGVQEGATSRGR